MTTEQLSRVREMVGATLRHSLPDREAIAALLESHAELIAACERAHQKLDRWPHPKRALHPQVETLQSIRYAVAKARGES